MASQTKDQSKTLYICDICTELKQISSIKGCTHSFCLDCITKHVSSKLENNVANVPCPGLHCENLLHLESLISVLPKYVVDSWNYVLCMNLLNDLPISYCPFKDCSETLLTDDCKSIVKESECPTCHRLFCAECKVPWHSGIDCEEFRKLDEDERGNDDLMVRKLAKENKWGRCPRCKFYVERIQGCPHITCWCKYEFCYGCGLQWGKDCAGCVRD
ncbi:hypothetical protein ACFE04_008045 [Oxalis oulophora]